MRVLKHDLAKGNTEGVDWMEVTRGFEAGVDMPFAVSGERKCIRLH